jgi:hypothetical protein
VAKTPKDLRYGIFRVGKSDFWLWPFFEPKNKSVDVKEKPKKLGSNILNALAAIEKDKDVLNQARAWVDWFAENWSQFFNSEQIEQLKKKTNRVFAENIGKEDLAGRVAKWKELIDAVDTWEIG